MAEIWKQAPDGSLECIDTETGAVIATQKCKKPPPGVKRLKGGRRPGRPPDTETHHYVLDNAGRKLWVPKGANPDDMPRLYYPYSEVTCDHILDQIVKGETLQDICNTEGLPPIRVVHKWMREHEEFRASYRESKRLRAEHFADQALGEAKNADEDNVQAKRLLVETLKWSAEVGDRETFGKSTKITGDAAAPIAIMVQTGIQRVEDKPIETTATPVKSDE